MIAIFLSKSLDVENCIYYFCTAADKQRNKATAVLRGLLWQLILKYPKFESTLRKWFGNEARTEKTLSSPETLWNIFLDLISQSYFSDTFCILDGLDECDAESKTWLARKLASLSKMRSHIEIANIGRESLHGSSEWLCTCHQS